MKLIMYCGWIGCGIMGCGVRASDPWVRISGVDVRAYVCVWGGRKSMYCGWIGCGVSGCGVRASGHGMWISGVDVLAWVSACMCVWVGNSCSVGGLGVVSWGVECGLAPVGVDQWFGCTVRVCVCVCVCRKFVYCGWIVWCHGVWGAN